MVPFLMAKCSIIIPKTTITQNGCFIKLLVPVVPSQCLMVSSTVSMLNSCYITSHSFHDIATFWGYQTSDIPSSRLSQWWVYIPRKRSMIKHQIPLFDDQIMSKHHFSWLDRTSFFILYFNLRLYLRVFSIFADVRSNVGIRWYKVL